MHFLMWRRSNGKEDVSLCRTSERVALSISNNIAEGSGAESDREYSRFLEIAKKSVFEKANMIIIFERRKLIDLTLANSLLYD